jgi:hypothetical protein
VEVVVETRDYSRGVGHDLAVSGQVQVSRLSSLGLPTLSWAQPSILSQIRRAAQVF